MNLKNRLRFFTLVCALLAASQTVMAQVLVQTAPSVTEESKEMNDWFEHLRETTAKRNRSYVGTFVVSSGDSMSAAKVWHVSEGKQQGERVEALSGSARSVFRHNEEVVTFMPDAKVARIEKRRSLGLFSERLKSADKRISAFYRIKKANPERVAGLEAQVIQLIPKDRLRFGYRVWTEQKQGLVVKWQTLDLDGKVLEQAVFSELQFDVPVKMDELSQMMNNVEGYRVEQKAELVKTSAQAEGWTLKKTIAGFVPLYCYKSASTESLKNGPIQWVFSDGLASVSLFVEPFNLQRHDKEFSASLGATQTLTKRVDAYWLTAMGEVPIGTLRLFADSLERKK